MNFILKSLLVGLATLGVSACNSSSSGNTGASKFQGLWEMTFGDVMDKLQTNVVVLSITGEGRVTHVTSENKGFGSIAENPYGVISSDGKLVPYETKNYSVEFEKLSDDLISVTFKGIDSADTSYKYKKISESNFKNKKEEFLKDRQTSYLIESKLASTQWELMKTILLAGPKGKETTKVTHASEINERDTLGGDQIVMMAKNIVFLNEGKVRVNGNTETSFQVGRGKLTLNSLYSPEKIFFAPFGGVINIQGNRLELRDASSTAGENYTFETTYVYKQIN